MILIDEKPISDLPNKSYFELNIRPGIYNLKADWSSLAGTSNSDFNLTAEAGKTHYIRLGSTMNIENTFFIGGTITPVISFDSVLNQVKIELAQKEIYQCHQILNIESSGL